MTTPELRTRIAHPETLIALDRACAHHGTPRSVFIIASLEFALLRCGFLSDATLAHERRALVLKLAKG